MLTETDHRVRLDYPYSFHTPPLTDLQPVFYNPTENRVSIYTNYPCIRQHKTCDEYTALCVELETPKGRLLVYGTIIGIYGNRHPSFQQSLTQQLDDIKRLSAGGTPVCICGDFNCSFSDGYYFTKQSRETLLRTFSDYDIELLTKTRQSALTTLLSRSALSPTVAFRSQNGIRISCCLTIRALLCAFRSGLTFFFGY